MIVMGIAARTRRASEAIAHGGAAFRGVALDSPPDVGTSEARESARPHGLARVSRFLRRPFGWPTTRDATGEGQTIRDKASRARNCVQPSTRLIVYVQ